MLRKKVKLLHSAVSMLFVVTLAVGCTAQTPSSSTAPTSTPRPSTAPAASAPAASEAPVTVEIAKPKEIFIVADTGFGDEAQQPKILEYFEQQNGIKLKLLKPPHNEYSAKLGLQLASGDVPDICEVPSADYMSYVKQGAFFPLRDLIYEYEPFQTVDSSFFEALDYKGEIYGVQKEIGNGNITYIRGDWMEKLNISMPKTYDEFINMLKRFRDEDPDGNTQNDTIPYISPGITPTYSVDWLQDAKYAFYKNEAGQWVDGFSEDKMLKALERLASAYQDGLIEPDVFNLSTSDARTKFYSGNVGCFTYWAGNWNGTINTELQKNIPTAYAVPMTPVADYKFSNRIAPILAITSHGNAKNPEGVFEYFMKYMFDCDEGQTWATHGVKDFTYKFEGDKMVALASPLSPDTVPSTPVGGWLNTLLRFTQFDDPFEVSDAVRDSQAMFLANCETVSIVPGVDAHVKYNPDIQLLRDEAVAKAMKGVLTPKEAHDEYKTKAKQYNLDQVVKELNEY